MKRSTKITTIIIIFFLIIAGVIVGRKMIGAHFSKKFGKRSPPGIIIVSVNQKKFENKISTFGTAIPIRIKSYKVEKFEILKPIKFNKKVKKGEIIANLKNRNIVAPFDGVIGKRNFSDDIKVAESSIIINLEDASILYVDVDVPEIYAPFVKEKLPVNIKFSGNNNKIYKGFVDSTASRIDIEKRSLAARVKLNNSNLEILPGSLLEITIKYNIHDSLGVPDTSVMLEGNKVYIYKVNKDNLAKKKRNQNWIKK